MPFINPALHDTSLVEASINVSFGNLSEVLKQLIEGYNAHEKEVTALKQALAEEKARSDLMEKTLAEQTATHTKTGERIKTANEVDESLTVLRDQVEGLKRSLARERHEQMTVINERMGTLEKDVAATSANLAVESRELGKASTKNAELLSQVAKRVEAVAMTVPDLKPVEDSLAYARDFCKKYEKSIQMSYNFVQCWSADSQRLEELCEATREAGRARGGGALVSSSNTADVSPSSANYNADDTTSTAKEEGIISNPKATTAQQLKQKQASLGAAAASDLSKKPESGVLDTQPPAPAERMRSALRECASYIASLPPLVSCREEWTASDVKQQRALDTRLAGYGIVDLYPNSGNESSNEGAGKGGHGGGSSPSSSLPSVPSSRNVAVGGKPSALGAAGGGAGVGGSGAAHHTFATFSQMSQLAGEVKTYQQTTKNTLDFIDRRVKENDVALRERIERLEKEVLPTLSSVATISANSNNNNSGVAAAASDTIVGDQRQRLNPLAFSPMVIEGHNSTSSNKPSAVATMAGLSSAAASLLSFVRAVDDGGPLRLSSPKRRPSPAAGGTPPSSSSTPNRRSPVGGATSPLVAAAKKAASAAELINSTTSLADIDQRPINNNNNATSIGVLPFVDSNNRASNSTRGKADIDQNIIGDTNGNTASNNDTHWNTTNVSDTAAATTTTTTTTTELNSAALLSVLANHVSDLRGAVNMLLSRAATQISPSSTNKTLDAHPQGGLGGECKQSTDNASSSYSQPLASKSSVDELKRRVGEAEVYLSRLESKKADKSELALFFKFLESLDPTAVAKGGAFTGVGGGGSSSALHPTHQSHTNNKRSKGGAPVGSLPPQQLEAVGTAARLVVPSTVAVGPHHTATAEAAEAEGGGGGQAASVYLPSLTSATSTTSRAKMQGEAQKFGQKPLDGELVGGVEVSNSAMLPLSPHRPGTSPVAASGAALKKNTDYLPSRPHHQVQASAEVHVGESDETSGASPRVAMFQSPSRHQNSNLRTAASTVGAGPSSPRGVFLGRSVAVVRDASGGSTPASISGGFH